MYALNKWPLILMGRKKFLRQFHQSYENEYIFFLLGLFGGRDNDRGVPAHLLQIMYCQTPQHRGQQYLPSGPGHVRDKKKL